MRPLAQRERRLLALGILLGLIAVVVLGAIVPLVGGMAARAIERSEIITPTMLKAVYAIAPKTVKRSVGL